MKKTLALFLVAVFAISGTSPATAEAKWTLISYSDYILGYTSFKYSCWSGVTNENLPTIEVFSNNTWVKAATGQILPAGSDIATPCESDHPIAVGFVWSVMAPSPPAYQTNRYTALYRQKIPDKEVVRKELVTKQVYEDQEKCCTTKVTSKKVPYIAKVKINGKTVNVIKYKLVKSTEQVNYTESVLVDKSEWVDVRSTETGWTGPSGNISIWSSEIAMRNDFLAMANALACAFGTGTNCKK